MFRITLTSLTLLITSQLFSQNNAQWRGENRDGIYNETNLLKQWPEIGPTLLWHFDELGDGHASAAVTDDMVYTAGTTDVDGFIIAFDHNGNQIWKTIYGPEWLENWDGVRSTPLINGEKVYLLSAYGVVSCLDAKKGNILWQVDLIKEYDAINIKFGITENLLIDGDKLFLTPGGTEANVIALDKNTGKLIWKSKGNSEISAYCSPALVKLPSRHLIVTHTEKHILGIDAESGILLWKHEFVNKYATHANTPFFYNGFLYCVTGTGTGGVKLKLSADGSGVEEVWKNTTLDSKLGGFVFINNRIIGSGDVNRNWSCVDWESGEELFNSIEISKKGNIIYADGLMYWYSETGEIALVELLDDKFNIISKFEVPYGEKQHWAHLVIHNKRLYVRHGESLMVYNISAE